MLPRYGSSNVNYIESALLREVGTLGSPDFIGSEFRTVKS